VREARCYADGEAKLKLPEINDGFANMKAGKTRRSVIVFDS
jgi:S-(hydroxymethyl)glutathione dehydrogenase / alcohol dehydrogenase